MHGAGNMFELALAGDESCHRIWYQLDWTKEDFTYALQQNRTGHYNAIVYLA